MKSQKSGQTTVCGKCGKIAGMFTRFMLLAGFMLQGFAVSAIGTDEEPGSRTGYKNTIFGSVGFIVVAASASVYYEREFFKSKNEGFALFGRVGATALIGDGSTDIYFLPGLGAGFLAGKGNSYLEVAGGSGYNLSSQEAFTPMFNIGYRRQNPNNRFMFRIGVGMPELLYVGAGFRF